MYHSTVNARCFGGASQAAGHQGGSLSGGAPRQASRRQFMLNKPPEQSSKNQSVRVIARAADVLRALKENDSGMSLGQISDRIGLPRSTVQRIVNALIAERFVIASANEGGLRIGPEIQSLAAAASRVDVAELVRPVLAELSEATGETVDLAVFRNDHMVFVDQVVGTQRLRAVSAVGEIFPMTVTANGKAALSLLDETTAFAIVKRELGDDKRRLHQVERELAAARRKNVAFDLDEHTDGISAVGTAFSTPAGVIYAASIPVPSQRFAQKRDGLVVELLAALKKVHAMIGTPCLPIFACEQPD